MAHEITTDDGLFLANNKPAWHGLGTVFEGHPTRAEAQAVAHPWEPTEEPVYLHHMDMNDEGEIREGFAEAPGHKAIRRSDNGGLLGVVNDTYEVVTNNELWDIAEALEKSGDDVQFETGGSLKGGSKVWLLIKLRDPLKVPGDPHGATIPYYTLQNSHDGSGALRGQATMTRIVCANTAHMADLDAKAKGTNFTFRHTKNVNDRIEQAQAALGLWRQGLTQLSDRYEVLLQQKLGLGGVDEFARRFFPEPEVGLTTDRQRENIHLARARWREVLYSETNEGTADTAYGLVQASVEYAEHVRKSHTSESKFTRSFLTRNQLISDAVRIAESVAS